MDRICNIIYLKEFNTKRIRTHWDYEDDLIDVIEKSGFKDNFTGLYMNRLRFLEERMERCIGRVKWFEKLKYTEELYSIKIDSLKNIRILFAFVKYKGNKFAVLLYPFEEKNKKKGSGNSYQTAKIIALKRLKEVIINE
ncbi:MAG: hypothetical protein HPY74_15575 [Firmicutes bacterium]|nr:hypothetical protein [Bacillota bacterium]